MENYRGDLTDIVRAGGGPIGSGDGRGDGSGFSGEVVPLPDWRFPADPMSYMEEPPVDDFGDPFSSLRDPLLHELDISNSGFFNSSSNSTGLMKTSGVEETAAAVFGGGRGGGGGCGGGGIGCVDEDHEMIKRPCNIFSRMLQISPNAKIPAAGEISPAELIKAASPLVNPNDLISAANNTSNGVQISSPRNTGIKRRKSQAKKVVCIPAPAPANSRPSTGEVVPSDLWAWRKYGQKPIKGSPYPRGYYRCSSSKGCSARKQVERSRTDPNMLVITYTSEHNHPWPTQRNALAGSTRSQPSKTNSASSKNSTTTSPSSHSQQKGTTSLKEEQHKEETNIGVTTVKEEREEFDKEIEMEDGDGGDHFSELGFPQSYRPILPDHASSQCDQDFFADLGEIEVDPLNLLFTQGFSGGRGDKERENNDDNNSNKKKATLDPFTSLFDWTGNDSSINSSNNNMSFGGAKRGL